MTYMKKNLHFFDKKKNYGPTDGLTDGRIDGWTDGPSYKDARTHLKTNYISVGAALFLFLPSDGFSSSF